MTKLQIRIYPYHHSCAEPHSCWQALETNINPRVPLLLLQPRGPHFIMGADSHWPTLGSTANSPAHWSWDYPQCRQSVHAPPWGERLGTIAKTQTPYSELCYPVGTCSWGSTLVEGLLFSWRHSCPLTEWGLLTKTGLVDHSWSTLVWETVGFLKTRARTY